MASALKTLAKSLFITLLENYPNPVSPTVFFRQASIQVIAFRKCPKRLADLREEGELQSNCVGSYTGAIRARTTFIYRVLTPERATLSIVRGNDRDWKIGQLKCRANAQASAITRLAVQDWLDQYALVV